MNRFSLIQSLIDKVKANVYLEIGVRDAVIIKDINAPYKYGIDPAFNLSRADKLKKIFHLLNFKAIECTSDYFFEKKVNKRIREQGIDVAFVDGLHSYGQVLKDVENCLKYLNPDGFIVLHDCNPISANGAHPIKESFDEITALVKSGKFQDWDGNWNGDVWKALVHLRIIHDDLEIFTVDADWGLGVIRRKKSKKLQTITIDELQIAGYTLLEKNRAELLNLITPAKFREYLQAN